MARNLIIGAIEGYTFDQIAPFFLSLRKVKFAGDVVVFSREIDATEARQRYLKLRDRISPRKPIDTLARMLRSSSTSAMV